MNVCSGGDGDAFYNALQVRRFLQLEIPRTGTYRVDILKSAVGTGNKNPQANLYQRGGLLGRTATEPLFQSDVVDAESETFAIEAGTYTLVVYEEDNVEPGGATVCFDVSLTEV